MGKKSDKGAEKRNNIRDALDNFRIDDPEFPEALADAAFTSGNYPYDKPMKGKRYDKDLQALQIELLKMTSWVKEKGERIVVIFEGRDAAGKGGAIHRVTQHLNPRSARVVALTKPTDTEKGQWYFQRYVQHLPTRGELVIFDRSWYNRAVVEPVNGFCTQKETELFLREVPVLENMLVDDGIRLIKIFLTIGQEMQLKRFHRRMHDPLKTWKLSPIDFDALHKWDAYSTAIEAMLGASHSIAAPWTVIAANDKRRTRLEVIRLILSHLDYAGRDDAVVGKNDPAIVHTAPAFLAAGGEE